MIILTEPDKRYLISYTEAFEEYKANGIDDYSFTDPDLCNIFEKFEDYRKERNLKPGRVGSDYYWLVDDASNTFLGEISIRHELNDVLRICGGHIGYGIRFACWNKGYGTMMLAMALEKAKQRGLDRVLITCDDTNIASARVMEKNECCFEDKVEYMRNGKKILIRRYWRNL